MKISSLLILITYIFFTYFSFSQTKSIDELRKELNKLIEPFNAKVGIAITHLETSDTLSINNNYEYPTQSTYKFPLGMAVMYQVDLGKMNLEQKIHISKEEMLTNTWSPLAKEFPDGNVDVSIAKLVEYTVGKSDNNGCDVLFKLLGGPKEVEKQMREWKYDEIVIQTTEAEMQADGTEEEAQKKNWCKPVEMNKILVDFFQGKYLSKESTEFLMKQMIETTTSQKRIKGKLPESAVTAHKTGSGYNVINDVGIVTLEDGTHLVLSIYICNSQEKFDDAEKLMAKIAWAAYRHFNG